MGYFISRDAERERGQADQHAAHEDDVDVDVRPPGKRTRTMELRKQQLRRHLRAAASGIGAALPQAIAKRLGAALGSDLSGVRVHVGSAPAQAAATLHARAYTVGQDIYFGAGHYDPSSEAGERLLAHEVAHTVQQQGATSDVEGSLAISRPGDGHEHEAERFAHGFSSGRPEAVTPVASGVISRSVIQADPLPGLEAAWFDVQSPPLTPVGQLKTEHTEYLTKIIGPKISGTFTVSIPQKRLPKDKTLEAPLPKVGIIQTLTSMTRTAVYRLGAAGPEKLVSHSRGQTRDAAETASERKADAAHYAPEAPFFQAPQELGTTGNVALEFQDQPVFGVVSQLDSGEKLIATRGSDNFNTSVGAKRDGRIVTMSPFGWSLSWDSEFDGTQIKTDPKKNAIAIDRTVKQGIYVNSEDYVNKLERETFDSVDAAMSVPVNAILALMLKVRDRGDTQSATNLAAAMDRLNPTFKVEVKLVTSPSFWPGKDNCLIWLHGSKLAEKSAQIDAADSKPAHLNFKWAEVFSAAGVTRGTTLEVNARVADKLGGSVEIPFPFNSGSGTIGRNQGAAAEFRVSVSLG